ncbi:histidine kinase [Nonomuraea sp. NEAU-A123]|uniref:histidine kinase n=1 Tax=Nonomuraea sp. NEAU-A123 TaxID=2839649 RepID=UPI001BE4BFE8|nr:histidine kinase [Nonomuraea sp. NEAU-A123]MBT2233549.1 hypothetical protein [Nonomuraea sp. NEAU-A123]
MRSLREALLTVATATVVALLTALGRRVPVDVPLLAVFSVGVSLSLLVRRALPLTAAATSAVVGLAGLAQLDRWEGMLVAMALFCTAVYHRPRHPGLVLALSTCWAVGTWLVIGAASALTSMLIMGLAPVATGYALRLHRDRAGQTLRLQRAEAERVLAEERTWLAGNVHDSVGHHLTAIRLRAAAARRTRGAGAGAARRAYRHCAAPDRRGRLQHAIRAGRRGSGDHARRSQAARTPDERRPRTGSAPADKTAGPAHQGRGVRPSAGRTWPARWAST